MSDNKLVPQNQGTAPQTNQPAEPKSGFVRMFSEPLSKRGWPRWAVYLMGLIGGVYLLNPTLGLLELIPDNLPIVGNLDEGGAVMLLLAGIVEVLEGRKQRQASRAAQAADPSQPEE